jgi:Phage tail tube protein
MPGPFNFESQFKSARNLVLTPNKQLAWNTPVAGASMTQRQRFDGAAILELKTTRRSDIDYAGKGTAFATNGQITSYDTSFSGFKAEASPWLLGWLLSFLCGTDTVTGVAAPYTHTFTFDETTRTAVPTSIYLQDTEDLCYTVPDFALNDVTITINDIGAVMVEFTGMGTGRLVLGTIAALPALAAETYVLGSDAALQFGPVGAQLSYIGRHMNTTIKLENQVTVHKAPGGGLFGIFIRKGNPKFSLTTTIAAKTPDDIFTLHQNDTACAYSLAVNSGAQAQLNVSIPQMHTKTTKLGFDGEMEIWQIEADETTCYDLAGTPPISLQVINAVAAYLVGA